MAAKQWKQDSNPGPAAPGPAFTTTRALGASQQKAGQWAPSYSERPPGALQAVMLPGELSGPHLPQVGQGGFPRKPGDSTRRKGKEQMLVLACGQL